MKEKEITPNEKQASQLSVVSGSASTYWVIESLLNNEIIYWTGNIPHGSIYQSERQMKMWTTNIHEAEKMKTEIDAIEANEELEIYGKVTEHMDIN